MELHSHYVLVYNCHVGDLLSCLGIRQVKVFHEFSGTENVIEIVGSSQLCKVCISVPVEIVRFVGVKPLLNFDLGEWLAILVVRATFLSSFATDVFAEEGTGWDRE